MSAYRETFAALRLRVEALESELERKNAELNLRISELSERDARLDRLRRAVEDIAPARRRPTRHVNRLLGASAVMLSVLGLVAGLRSASTRHDAPSEAPRAQAAQRVRIPRTLAVAIDARVSMQPHLGQAATAIVKLVDSLEDDDRVGILQVDGFGSRIVLPVSTAASSRAGLASVLASVSGRAPDWPAQEQFAISRGINAATELLERWTPDARIIVVTDGMDATWEFTEGTAAHAADRGFRVSALGAGRFVAGYLESVARAGHGSLASLGDPASLDRFIREQRE